VGVGVGETLEARMNVWATRSQLNPCCSPFN
jgi:hypothetical protein